MNKTILIGHVGQDSKLNSTKSGTAVANFTFAVNESYLDKDQVRQTITTWYAVSAWGKMAKTVAENVSKGRMLYLEGKVGIHTWEAEEGTKNDLTLKLSYIRFLDKAVDDNSEAEIAIENERTDD